MDLVWYATLRKPFFSPPTFLFGPVWTFLYLAMAIAAFLVFRHGWKSADKRNALKFFVLQLFANLIWSPLFFGLHNISAAMVDLVILWALIYKTIGAFSKVNRVAAYLLYPYIVWVSFAGILNLSFWILNG